MNLVTETQLLPWWLVNNDGLTIGIAVEYLYDFVIKDIEKSTYQVKTNNFNDYFASKIKWWLKNNCIDPDFRGKSSTLKKILK